MRASIGHIPSTPHPFDLPALIERCAEYLPHTTYFYTFRRLNKKMHQMINQAILTQENPNTYHYQHGLILYYLSKQTQHPTFFDNLRKHYADWQEQFDHCLSNPHITLFHKFAFLCMMMEVQSESVRNDFNLCKQRIVNTLLDHIHHQDGNISAIATEQLIKIRHHIPHDQWHAIISRLLAQLDNTNETISASVCHIFTHLVDYIPHNQYQIVLTLLMAQFKKNNHKIDSQACKSIWTITLHGIKTETESHVLSTHQLTTIITFFLSLSLKGNQHILEITTHAFATILPYLTIQQQHIIFLSRHDLSNRFPEFSREFHLMQARTYDTFHTRLIKSLITHLPECNVKHTIRIIHILIAQAHYLSILSCQILGRIIASLSMNTRHTVVDLLIEMLLNPTQHTDSLYNKRIINYMLLETIPHLPQDDPWTQDAIIKLHTHTTVQTNKELHNTLQTLLPTAVPQLTPTAQMTLPTALPSHQTTIITALLSRTLDTDANIMISAFKKLVILIPYLTDFQRDEIFARIIIHLQIPLSDDTHFMLLEILSTVTRYASHTQIATSIQALCTHLMSSPSVSVHTVICEALDILAHSTSTAQKEEMIDMLLSQVGNDTTSHVFYLTLGAFLAHQPQSAHIDHVADVLISYAKNQTLSSEIQIRSYHIVGALFASLSHTQKNNFLFALYDSLQKTEYVYTIALYRILSTLFPGTLEAQERLIHIFCSALGNISEHIRTIAYHAFMQIYTCRRGPLPTSINVMLNSVPNLFLEKLWFQLITPILPNIFAPLRHNRNDLLESTQANRARFFQSHEIEITTPLIKPNHRMQCVIS